MAVEILFNTIQEFAYPLIEACGLHLDPYGYIVDKENKKLCFKNPRYTEGDDTNEISPVLYPVIPLKDSDYLEIKDKIDLDLFNPFTNIKHMIIIAVKMKHLAVVDLSPDLLKTAIDEDDWDKFDDYIGLSNDINMLGQIDYALVDLYSQNKQEIVRYACSPDEPVKGLWALCVEIYNKYVSQRPPYLKQFQDIDKSWKKIVAAMKKWDKLRKGIVAEIHKEDNQNMNIEYMDLSESVTPGEAINVFTMDKPLTSDDFLMCEDGEDMQGKALQDFLTSLFNKDSLKPYVEPVEADDEVETVVTPISKTVDLTKGKPESISIKEISKEKDPLDSTDIISESKKHPELTVMQWNPGEEKPTVIQKGVEEKSKPVVSSNSIFKKKTGQTQHQSLNFNNPGMYGNMFGQQGYGMMGQNSQMTMNMDDLCLGDVINPYANY